MTSLGVTCFVVEVSYGVLSSLLSNFMVLVNIWKVWNTNIWRAMNCLDVKGLPNIKLDISSSRVVKNLFAPDIIILLLLGLVTSIFLCCVLLQIFLPILTCRSLYVESISWCGASGRIFLGRLGSKENG